MHATDDRLEFAPPPQPGLVRAFGLAVVAHLLLAVALTQGLKWQREAKVTAVEAELWSALPQQAAPPEPVAPPPPPPPPPAPPRPVVRPAPPPEPPVQKQADIAIEREKHKRELQRQQQAELEREREREREQQKRKLEAQKKREDDQARRKQEQQKLAAEAKRKDDEKKRKQQQEQEEREAQRVAKQREENLNRIRGMAGGTGAPSSAGTAARASGPSPSWGGRVQARVRPNIVFTDDISGNPTADVEVRLAPDGTIIGKRLVRSSGVKAWDEAVLRALDKTEVLPRDADGTVPSPVTISFKPKG